MDASFKIEGLAELEASLTELPKATAKNTAVRAMTKALDPFDIEWRSIARRRSGALAASGGIGTKLSKRQASLNTKSSPVEVYAGPGALAQATQEEFGNAHEAPHPYVRPAWDSTKDLVLDNLGHYLGQEIEASRARLARKQARVIAQNGG